MNRKTNALRERWGCDLIDQAGKAFEQNRVFTPFPPLTVNGLHYQDLRGLPIREPLRNTVLEHLDFTSARLEHNGGLLEITALDCLFVETTLERNLKGIFRQCRFDGATLDGATIFGGSTFSECTFIEAEPCGADPPASPGAAHHRREGRLQGEGLRRSHWALFRGGQVRPD